jgi:hypothetical protein
MAIRVKHVVTLQISRDTEGQRKLYWSDEVSDQVVIDSLEKSAGSMLAVEPSAIETLTFGDVADVRGLYLEVNAVCLVRLNGGVQSIPLEPAPEAAAAKLFFEGPLTGVEVQNTSTTDALIGLYVVWGDPTA